MPEVEETVRRNIYVTSVAVNVKSRSGSEDSIDNMSKVLLQLANESFLVSPELAKREVTRPHRSQPSRAISLTDAG
jgi:hypothetical protein